MLKKGVLWSLFLLSGFIAHAQVTFVIEKLPGATHSSDTVFICGSFNNWNPQDKNFIVSKQLNGQRSITLPAGIGKIEYKFTRGTWNKVETDARNQLIPNRTFVYGNGQTVYVPIENWLDLGGARPLNYLIFYFFACAFQGIALCFLVWRITKSDPQKFKGFILLNSFIVVMLLSGVVHEIVNPIWQSYLIFVFHIAAFCWGPITLIFLQGFSNRKLPEGTQRYFIPAAITGFIVLLRAANVEYLSVLSVPLLFNLTLGNTLFIVFMLCFNLFMFIRAYTFYSTLKLHRPSQRDERISFPYYVYWISIFALVLVVLNTSLLAKGLTHPFFVDFHILGFLLSGLIFFETYYLWRYPEIMKEAKVTVIHTDDHREWLDKLNTLMRIEKPYRHPDLSVSDLADMLGARAHVLSRVINEHHQKNFRDFVNTYRVEEFIELVNSPQYKHYTFLALAQEVGFNSKSTFNVAFKKLTQRNPREYFKTQA